MEKTPQSTVSINKLRGLLVRASTLLILIAVATVLLATPQVSFAAPNANLNRKPPQAKLLGPVNKGQKVKPGVKVKVKINGKTEIGTCTGAHTVKIGKKTVQV